MADSQTITTLPRRKVPKLGYELSVVGAGGWIGQKYDPSVSPDPNKPVWGSVSRDQALKEETAIAAVRRAIELGINYFDTAPMYGNGEAEYLLGVGLHALSKEERAKTYLSTKVGNHPQRVAQYDADSIHWSLEQSLRKLHTDHLDIVHIHDPQTHAHVDQILGPGGAAEALEKLKEQGVVGGISMGVMIHSFLKRAIDSGRFDAILPSYDHTPIRNSLTELIDHAAANNVAVIYGSPYLAGLLAGIDPDEAVRRRPADRPLDHQRAKKLYEWAKARGVDLGALAFQYSLRNPNITVVLCGPRDASEVEANVRHATAQLPAGIWEELDAFIATLGPVAPGGEVDPKGA